MYLKLFTAFCFSLAFFSGDTFGKLKVPSGQWIVKDISPAKESFDLVISKDGMQEYFSVIISTKKITRTDQKIYYKDFRRKQRQLAKISYDLNNCKSIDEELLSQDSLCESVTFKIDDLSYTFKSEENGEQIYIWETYLDPVIFNDVLIAKRLIPKSKSGDTGKTYPSTIYGVVAFDLKEKKRLSSYVNKFFRTPLGTFASSFVNLLYVDEENSNLWIGNEYGIFGLNNRLEEFIACVFDTEKTSKINLVCLEPDYLLDVKKDQARLLLEKHHSLLSKKDPPIDATAIMAHSFACKEKAKENANDLRKCEHCYNKLGWKLIREYKADVSPNKNTNIRYKNILECKM